MTTFARRLVKRVAIALALLLLLLAAFGLQTWYGRPLTIDLFFARTALQFALESPELLSRIRVLDQLGIDWHNDELDDAGIAAGDRLFERVEAARETLRTYDDATLDEGDRLSKAIALHLLDLAHEAKRFRFHTYPVNQLFGVQNGFPDFMDTIHQVEDLEDAWDYVSRLSKVGRKFDQVIEGLELRESRGIVPPHFVIVRVLDEMEAFVSVPPRQNILYRSLATKCAGAGLEAAARDEVLAAAAREIEATVYPAYGRLIAYFEALEPKVTTDHGVWKLPDGDAFYDLALRFFTSTDLSADEIHGRGLQEVDRIQGEILDTLGRAGYETSGGFEATMEALAADPRFAFEDSESGRQAILDGYRAILDEIQGGLDRAFGVRPRAPLEVRPVQEYRAKTAPAAHYSPPALDGSRPGIFFVNLHDVTLTRRYGMRTLAYHEGIPGHHFQLALQQEQEDLPMFRRLVPSVAYSEGWALYAERLAWELGFEQDPFDNVGRLQAELFRQVRLVVDTGIHRMRWTRQEAIDYMRRNTGMSEGDVVVEVERYFVMPGQACAYAIGMMTFLDLRERARQQLGESFDLPSFHDRILRAGSMPLGLLEGVVDQYIEDGGRPRPAAPRSS